MSSRNDPFPDPLSILSSICENERTDPQSRKETKDNGLRLGHDPLACSEEIPLEKDGDVPEGKYVLDKVFSAETCPVKSNYSTSISLTQVAKVKQNRANPCSPPAQCSVNTLNGIRKSPARANKVKSRRAKLPESAADVMAGIKNQIEQLKNWEKLKTNKATGGIQGNSTFNQVPKGMLNTYTGKIHSPRTNHIPITNKTVGKSKQGNLNFPHNVINRPLQTSQRPKTLPNRTTSYITNAMQAKSNAILSAKNAAMRRDQIIKAAMSAKAAKEIRNNPQPSAKHNANVAKDVSNKVAMKGAPKIPENPKDDSSKKCSRKHPRAPKRFKSPYICFFMAKKDTVREEMGPDASFPEHARAVAKLWKALPVVGVERKYWEEQARKDQIRFAIESENYNGPWRVNESERKRTKKDPTAPKRPMSAFLHYSQEMRKIVQKENPQMPFNEVSKLLAQMWKIADQDTRKKHCDWELEQRKQYNQAVAIWREEQLKKKAEDRKALDKSVTVIRTQQKNALIKTRKEDDLSEDQIYNKLMEIAEYTESNGDIIIEEQDRDSKRPKPESVLSTQVQQDKPSSFSPKASTDPLSLLSSICEREIAAAPSTRCSVGVPVIAAEKGSTSPVSPVDFSSVFPSRQEQKNRGKKRLSADICSPSNAGLLEQDGLKTSETNHANSTGRLSSTIMCPRQHKSTPKNEKSPYTFHFTAKKDEVRKVGAAVTSKEQTQKDLIRFALEKQTYKGPTKVVRTGKRKANKDLSAIKRPISAYQHFCEEMRQDVKVFDPGMANDKVSKVLAQMWKVADAETRKKHCDWEEQEQKQYRKNVADWCISQGKPKEPIRKVHDEIVSALAEMGSKSSSKAKVTSKKTSSLPVKSEEEEIDLLCTETELQFENNVSLPVGNSETPHCSDALSPAPQSRIVAQMS
eukprot:CAMPEP_0195540080 /NCGR_PEP_ID=MMETSP0794_2-20130614/50387_1 /TAXON_ID=515487 /ORGANISM="Stephanopyxis turris, Strain CCMP 815" /LENGTH=915 /DNA_ID=CAMNT_0040674141 /DNA_START=365 /DNA_END=3112 /DNA_ORIENTATION=-